MYSGKSSKMENQVGALETADILQSDLQLLCRWPYARSRPIRDVSEVNDGAGRLSLDDKNSMSYQTRTFADNLQTFFLISKIELRLST